MTSVELDYAILATPPPSRRTRPATGPPSVSGAVLDDAIEYSPLSPPEVTPEEPVERQPWSRRGRKADENTEYMVLAPPGTVPARKPRPGQAKPVPVRVASEEAIETIDSQPTAPFITPATNLHTNPPPPSVRFDVPTGRVTSGIPGVVSKEDDDIGCCCLCLDLCLGTCLLRSVAACCWTGIYCSVFAEWIGKKIMIPVRVTGRFVQRQISRVRGQGGQDANNNV